MLTYTTLFVASLIVAAVIFFLYRVISDSSRSVYSSKNPLAIIDSTQGPHKDTTGSAGPAYKPTPFGQDGHASPKHVARSNPAMPTETVNWGWQGSGGQLREPQLHLAKAAGESRHCSLFDVNATETRPQTGQYTGRLHREEKLNSTGRTYKVTRKEDHRTTPEPESLNKPWGW